MSRRTLVRSSLKFYSPRLTRAVVDVVATVYALGFHQEFKDAPGLPSFLAESRRKVFWFAYMSDKSFATFLEGLQWLLGNFILPIVRLEPILGHIQFS